MPRYSLGGSESMSEAREKVLGRQNARGWAVFGRNLPVVREAKTPTSPRRRTAVAAPVPKGVDLSVGGRAVLEGWFAGKGWSPWEFQAHAWDAFARNESGLVTVATGAGKTYAAFGGPLIEMMDSLAGGGSMDGLRVLYITPLRAVSRDIEKALETPIREMGLPVTVEGRTGDTATSVRNKQRDRLPNVLVTTPESLTLLLTRPNASALFATLRAVIVDEWHELLTSKRGTQVELALARLRNFSPAMRTWALSATISNPVEAAQCLVGTGLAPTIVHGAMARQIVVDSVIPGDLKRLPLAGHLGLNLLPDVIEAITPDVEAHRSVLLFTNTRSQSERWYNGILSLKPEWAGVMALHHGSIDRADREAVEAGLKDGTIHLVVATSSLDLGVDFAPVERVLQVGSPKGIARLMQRAGRAAHRPNTACRVTCVPTHGLELFEIAAARTAIDSGTIEPRPPHAKPLDVLAQHLVTCGLGGGFDPEALYREVCSAWSYRDLTREEFEWSLALVRDGGGTFRAYPEFHKVLDQGGRYVVESKRIAQMHRLNVGTIVGDATVELRFLGGRTIGRIEEYFVAHLKAGQQFVFAGKVLQYVMFKDLVAYVRAGRGGTNLTPIWGGTRLPISESLAESIRRTLQDVSEGKIECPELQAARGIVRVQQKSSCIPCEDELLVETYQTREGYHCFVFPFDGRLVHGGLAALLALRLSRSRSGTFAIAVNDYGLELLAPEPYPFQDLIRPELFTVDGLVDDAIQSVNMSELAKLQFREVARIAGLVNQSFPGAQRSAKQTQVSSSLLFEVLQEFDPENMLLHQARREVLERHFEQGRLRRTLARLALSKIRMHAPERLTPLAFPLLIERQSAKLSSETIVERVQRMRDQWEI